MARSCQRPERTTLFVPKSTHTETVGFDPRRQHKRTSFDYYFVAASVVAGIGLLIWAVFA